jgi:hypothetical protein
MDYVCMDINFTKMPKLLYLFSFLIYFCFFITDLLIRQNSLKTNTLHFIFYRTTITILFTLIWVLISGDYFYTPSFNQIAYVALLSGITAFGIIGFTEANKHMVFANILSVNIIGIIFQPFPVLCHLKGIRCWHLGPIRATGSEWA